MQRLCVLDFVRVRSVNKFVLLFSLFFVIHTESWTLWFYLKLSSNRKAVIIINYYVYALNGWKECVSRAALFVDLVFADFQLNKHMKWITWALYHCSIQYSMIQAFITEIVWLHRERRWQPKSKTHIYYFHRWKSIIYFYGKNMFPFPWHSKKKNAKAFTLYWLMTFLKIHFSKASTSVCMIRHDNLTKILVEFTWT